MITLNKTEESESRNYSFTGREDKWKDSCVLSAMRHGLMTLSFVDPGMNNIAGGKKYAAAYRIPMEQLERLRGYMSNV